MEIRTRAGGSRPLPSAFERASTRWNWRPSGRNGDYRARPPPAPSRHCRAAGAGAGRRLLLGRPWRPRGFGLWRLDNGTGLGVKVYESSRAAVDLLLAVPRRFSIGSAAGPGSQSPPASPIDKPSSRGLRNCAQRCLQRCASAADCEARRSSRAGPVLVRTDGRQRSRLDGAAHRSGGGRVESVSGQFGRFVGERSAEVTESIAHRTHVISSFTPGQALTGPGCLFSVTTKPETPALRLIRALSTDL